MQEFVFTVYFDDEPAFHFSLEAGSLKEAQQHAESIINSGSASLVANGFADGNRDAFSVITTKNRPVTFSKSKVRHIVIRTKDEWDSAFG